MEPKPRVSSKSLLRLGLIQRAAMVSARKKQLKTKRERVAPRFTITDIEPQKTSKPISNNSSQEPPKASGGKPTEGPPKGVNPNPKDTKKNRRNHQRGGKPDRQPADAKSYYDKCKEKRIENGGFMLSKELENKIYRMKKTLREQKQDEGKIRAIINRFRRKEELKARKAMARRCLCCRSYDHVIKDCPRMIGKNNYTDGGSICFRCGSGEHTLRDCTSKSENLEYASCFICKEKGHLSAQCPKNDKGVYPRGGACRKCGSKFHLVKDCKEDVEENEDEELTLTTLDGPTMSADAEVLNVRSHVKPKPKLVQF